MPHPDKIRVLVLEDDDLDFKVLVRHLDSLRDPQYILLRAKDVEEARVVIADNEIDAALIDYRLPSGASGLDFVKELGGREAPFPLIMLTGMDSGDLDKQAILSGAYDYINKLSLSRELVDRSIRFSIKSHKHEHDLRKTSVKFEEQATINRNILSVVSHEMKSPISSLIGYCDFLIEECESLNARDAAKKMKSASIHLEDFLRNLSEFVRLDSGAAEISKDEFNAHSMVVETIEFFQPYAKHKGISIDTQLDGATDNTFIGDRLRIRQVLINLIKNAVNYSDQGTIIVTASLDEQSLSIRVKDEGVGIPEEKVTAILDDCLTRQKPGTGLEGGLGLGLSISRRLLRLMRGTFILESASGFGTTAGFDVPLELKGKAQAA